MKYSQISEMKTVVEKQISILEIYNQLLEYDTSLREERELPKIENLGAMKSHFLMELKASQGLLSLINIHLADIKAKDDEERKKIKEKSIQTKPSIPIEKDDSINLFATENNVEKINDTENTEDIENDDSYNGEENFDNE